MPTALLGDIKALIEEGRRQAAATVNMGLTLLYWRIGQRIHAEILQGERAAYGEQIVATLSRQLVAEYGRGYTEKNLRRMIQFAQAFLDENIVATLSRQLSWSHFRELLPLNKPFQRDFYAEMCRLEGWSTRTLHERIDSLLYERTALSKLPDELIRQELATLRSKGEVVPALVLKDPSTTASSSAWWLWNLNKVNSNRNTRAKWSCICAGWPSMKLKRAKTRHWASSSVRARTANKLNYWN